MPKAGIHPKYVAATVTCACGHVHATASTRGSFSVEICSQCHPFFTGKEKLLDRAGRIERFTRKYAKNTAAAAAAAVPADKPEKA